MKLTEMQKLSTKMIEVIDRKTGRDHDVDLTMIHLAEEFGEVARAVYNKKTGRAPVSGNEIGGEIADSVMLLAHLATRLDVDIEDAVNKKTEELKKRFEI